jgi:hypothetical protein
MPRTGGRQAPMMSSDQAGLQGAPRRFIRYHRSARLGKSLPELIRYHGSARLVMWHIFPQTGGDDIAVVGPDPTRNNHLAPPRPGPDRYRSGSRHHSYRSPPTLVCNRLTRRPPRGRGQARRCGRWSAASTHAWPLIDSLGAFNGGTHDTPRAGRACRAPTAYHHAALSRLLQHRSRLLRWHAMNLTFVDRPCLIALLPVSTPV